MTAPLLELIDLSAGYGDVPIVRDFATRLAARHDHHADRRQRRRQIDAAARDLRHHTGMFSGQIVFDGEAIERLRPWERLQRGIGFVPQGRCNFPAMSVAENLKIGCYTLPRRDHAAAIERVTALFPMLQADAGRVAAGNLSGGEQQMLEMAMVLVTRAAAAAARRALARPVAEDAGRGLRRGAARSRRRASPCLVVEQNVHGALLISEPPSSWSSDANSWRDRRQSVRHDPRIREAYLGGNIKQTAQKRMTSARLAVDIGGTFTDFALECGRQALERARC